MHIPATKKKDHRYRVLRGGDLSRPLKQFALAATAVILLWVAMDWLAPYIIRGLLGGW
jgi:hypothetical protein